jgi:hypothetical protein
MVMPSDMSVFMGEHRRELTSIERRQRTSGDDDGVRPADETVGGGLVCGDNNDVGRAVPPASLRGRVRSCGERTVDGVLRRKDCALSHSTVRSQ